MQSCYEAIAARRAVGDTLQAGRRRVLSTKARRVRISADAPTVDVQDWFVPGALLTVERLGRTERALTLCASWSRSLCRFSARRKHSGWESTRPDSPCPRFHGDSSHGSSLTLPVVCVVLFARSAVSAWEIGCAQMFWLGQAASRRSSWKWSAGRANNHSRTTSGGGSLPP